MTAKPATQRTAEANARKLERGMKQVRSLWAHPEDIPAIRTYAARLAKRRERARKEAK